MTQHERIREFMLDGHWRSLHEISQATGYAETSISAQLRHLRKARFGGYRVERRRRRTEGGHDSGTWEYRVTVHVRQGVGTQGRIF